MKLSAAMSGGKAGGDGGGKCELDLTEYKARAGKRESRGPNLIHEELGEGRYRSWHDPQGRASNESMRSISKAMMSSWRTSMASSRRSSFQNLNRTPGPQGSSPSMVGEDCSFYGAGFYTTNMLNGPHKVIGGSQASSLSGERESRTFLRDSEYYHDDRRSWNTNSSRASLGGSSTASDAYLLPRDVLDYDEEGGERIPLEEQVAFIKAQQQDTDRQRYEQQLWLDRMEGVLQERSDNSSGEYFSRTLLEPDDPQSKNSTLDGGLSSRSSKLHEEHQELDEHIGMSDPGTSRPLSLDQESIISERLTHNISPTTTAFTGDLEYL
ncbi:hypothetical protein BG000_008782 [Podila horticola]|nr:hypothetical protein BG000_008782 [Podila horticola]